ncbi:glycosyltransferase [Candidatus Pacearchaeota archaeon]|nr:glycosyltransferase [Candidatus Pacearchaeota archaeon]
MTKKKLIFAAWTSSNTSYFAHNTWYKPLKRIFGDFIIFDPQQLIYQYGHEEMNRMFLDLVGKEKPDYIFFWLIYDEFSVDTFIKLREISPKTKLINFFGDDDTRFDIYSRYYSLFIDFPLMSQKNYLNDYYKEGIKNVHYSCGVNTEEFKPLKLKKKYDVTFIGTPNQDRAEYIRFLQQNGVNIKVFGSGWDKYPEFNEINGGKVNNEELLNIINESKINISFTKNYVDKPHFKSRVFEICACNAFLLTEFFSGYYDFYKEGKEIITFKTKDEMLEKVNFYLKDNKKREKIAKAGYIKTIKNYDQYKHFEKLFSEIFSKEKEPSKKILIGKDYKIAKIKKEELNDIDSIKEKLKDYDYISFFNKDAIYSKYWDFFHVYPIKNTKKPISICDPYLYSNSLGKFLSIYAPYSFQVLDKKDFYKILDPSQIVVEKNYFLKNINEFKLLLDRKEVDIINENNTSFILIPLVSIKNIENLGHEKMTKVSLPTYEVKIHVLARQKKLFYDKFIYFLIFKSILSYPFILRSLILKIFLKKQKIKESLINQF